MGLFDLLKRKHNASLQPEEIDSATQALSQADKERIMVERVTTEDMAQFLMIPYQLDCPVHKNIVDRGHPFAYMDLNKVNQAIAREELARINEHIFQAHRSIKALPRDIFIKTEEIAFNEYNRGYGYTRLICTPFTFTGKVSKFPLSLDFMTFLDSETYTAHGQLYYGKDGNVLKADVNIWKNPGNSRKATGWFFNFKTVERALVLCQVKSTINSDKSGLPGVVYQFEEQASF